VTAGRHRVAREMAWGLLEGPKVCRGVDRRLLQAR
jgi:hypothetical protein